MSTDSGTRAFELKVKPQNYGDLNQPLPDDLPKPNKGCGIHTNQCFGLILSWIVAPEEAMDYDSVEDTIATTRHYLTDDSGLIECNGGVTAKGHQYIYNIQKMQAMEPGMARPEVSYCLNFNVNLGGDDYYINGSFTEEGMTGARDSFGFAVFQNAVQKQHPDEHYTTKELLQMFYKDPYNSDYRKGFLMNFSERDLFDERFPEHPLSMIRKYVKWVIKNN